ncbi:hypothetical protein M0R72_13760 [Candidatus Pacearchaeota archaeon]|jgi:hypothetical protein|nr:hypothetical protein [Candidatus Pacearchaeota archaeon]
MGNLANSEYGFLIPGADGNPVAHKEVALANGELGLAYPAACGRPVASLTAPLENRDYGFLIMGAKGRPVAVKTALESPCGLPAPLYFFGQGGLGLESGARPTNIRWEEYEDEFDPEAPSYWYAKEFLSYAALTDNFPVDIYLGDRGRIACKTDAPIPATIQGININLANYINIGNSYQLTNSNYGYFPLVRQVSSELEVTFAKDIVLVMDFYSGADDVWAVWVDDVCILSEYSFGSEIFVNLLDENRRYAKRIPKNTPLNIKQMVADDYPSEIRMGHALYILTEDIDAKPDWHLGLNPKWINVGVLFNWTATYSGSSWVLALTSVTRGSESTDWATEGEATATRSVYGIDTQPASPNWTPS